jgi:hypothetical protein
MSSTPIPPTVSAAPAQQSENPSARPKPLWSRAITSVAAIGLTLCLIVITELMILGWFPITRVALEEASKDPSPSAIILSSISLIVGGLLPILLMVIAARKSWINWKTLAFAWVAVVPILGWLAMDDVAVREPLTLEQLSPPFNSAQTSFDVMMRYSKRNAAGKAFDSIQWAPPANVSWNTREPAAWKEMVVKHRAAIEADWATLAPQRKWLEELATFDRIGDLTPARLDADLPAFRVWRVLSQRTCAIATLQGIDGKHDDAIATLLPLLQTSRRMQVNSRTLVRSMVAVVIERMCIETATMVADMGPLSPASRARLHATLTDDNPGLMARRLLMIEYAGFFPALASMRFGDHHFSNDRFVHHVLRIPLNVFSDLFFLPNATTNIYGERVRVLAALAEKRALGEFAVSSKSFDDSQRRTPGMRNIGGRLLLNMSIPNYEKILDAHWKLADLREALRKRVST